MARVGLVGGLGPESTIDYYERIIEGWQRHEPGSAPSIVIDSLDVQQAIRLVSCDRPGLIAYLAGSVQRLAAAGADFVAMTANTPHLVFDEVASRSPVPLLSIVETCAAAAQRLGLRRVALLGTRFTMEASFYPEVCTRYDVTVVPPGEEDRAWIHDRYLGELLKGEFTSSARDAFRALVARLRDQTGIDGVVLGGTELPLLLPDETIAGLPALDTTALHVEAIVSRLREGERAA